MVVEAMEAVTGMDAIILKALSLIEWYFSWCSYVDGNRAFFQNRLLPDVEIFQPEISENSGVAILQPILEI